MTYPERPLSEVLHEIGSNLQCLLRDEWRFAWGELREELRRVRSGAILVGVASAAALLAVLFFLLSLQFALTRVLPAWAAALIIGASLALCAAAAALGATRRLKEVGPIVPKTRRILRETAEWAKQQVK